MMEIVYTRWDCVGVSQVFQVLVVFWELRDVHSQGRFLDPIPFVCNVIDE